MSLGDLSYGGWSDTAEFRLRADGAGDVQLRLQIDGIIGPMKSRHFYDGRLAGSSVYKPGYRKTYTIHAS